MSRSQGRRDRRELHVLSLEVVHNFVRRRQPPSFDQIFAPTELDSGRFGGFGVETSSRTGVRTFHAVLVGYTQRINLHDRLTVDLVFSLHESWHPPIRLSSGTLLDLVYRSRRFPCLVVSVVGLELQANHFEVSGSVASVVLSGHLISLQGVDSTR